MAKKWEISSLKKTWNPFRLITNDEFEMNMLDIIRYIVGSRYIRGENKLLKKVKRRIRKR